MSDERLRSSGQEIDSIFKSGSTLAERIGSKAKRKLRMQSDKTQGVWFGLGMSGLVGWSVSVPTLLGAMLGIWWDRHHAGPHSWTLMLMVIGLLIGCSNAWHWIRQQNTAMDRQDERIADE